MNKKFYITTPIYYANGKPHVGTAYTSLIADTIARMKRMAGYQVKFTTGTDENGQKMKQKAASEGKEVMEFLDEIAKTHKDARDTLAISYTDFIRTTHPKHKEFVQEVLMKTKKAGDIYKGTYEGLYCVGCEGFKKTGDLIEHDGNLVCPDHLKKPDSINEQNRFFSLKKYQNFLENYYQNNVDFCQPSFRFNEMKSFVEQGLEDFSISREGSDFGIPIPFEGDEGSVVYIRFDALYNYLTTCMYPQSFTKDGESVSGEINDMSFWNDGEVMHTIGKDISRFHAIFRPAMLESAGFKLPNKELINGFFTVDGQKMSKSLGNNIDPVSVVLEHGRDALVYYFFNDIKIGSDGDFSQERFIETKENVLKKGRGNLVSRVVNMAKKNNVSHVNLAGLDLGLLKELASDTDLDLLLICENGGFDKKIDLYLSEIDLMKYTRDRFALVQLGNKYVDETKPRVKIKEGEGTKEEAEERDNENKQNLQILLWLLKNIAILGAPILVDGFSGFTNIVDIVSYEGRKKLETSSNDLKNGDSWNEILLLQEFDIEFSKNAHLY